MGLYGKKSLHKRSPSLPKAVGTELSALLCWNQMVRAVMESSAPPTERINMSTRFSDFTKFYEWFKAQRACVLEEVALNKDLLFEGNKLYSDNTCVVVPKEIQDVLACCRITRSDLEALKEEVARQGSPDPQKRLQEAYSASKAQLEDTLRELADKYQDYLDPIAYRALRSYEVKISN